MVQARREVKWTRRMGLRRSHLKCLSIVWFVLNFFSGIAPIHSFAQQKSGVVPPVQADIGKATRQRDKAGIRETADFDPARVEAVRNEIQSALDGLKIKMQLVETEHLLVFTDLAPAESTSIAELAEKSFISSCRFLKIGDTKSLFSTKLAVLVLEKDRFYDALQKVLFRTSFTASGSVLWRTDGESPCLLVSNLPAFAVRDPVFSNSWRDWTSRFVGTVVLLKRFPAYDAPSAVPVWLRDGFGLYASLVAKDDPELTQTYRSLIRERIQDKVRMFDFSSGQKDFYTFHVSSVVEYLLSVHGHQGFEAFILVLQKQKVARDQRVSLDLQGELGWDRETMERHWRHFAKTGQRLAR